MALSEEQRAGLWRAKLHSLAREHFGREQGVDHAVSWGAALEHEGVWTALIEVAPARSFGQALVLAARHQATSLDLLVVSDAPIVARRATLFDPAPTVWAIDGTALTAAEPGQPEPSAGAAELIPEVAELLEVDGVDVIIEHGVTMGEYRGLEVARVTGSGADQRLDVGVGAYDQGAFAVMNPEMTPAESLANVVSQVSAYRGPGAEPHPINRLARERWVRSELLADPSLIDMASLQRVAPPTERDGIRDVAIAPALGETSTGERVLVACTVGIDLDAVPAAVDLAETHGVDRILMVLPDRDRHPLVLAVAARSRRPVDFATAPQPWP